MNTQTVGIYALYMRCYQFTRSIKPWLFKTGNAKRRNIEDTVNWLDRNLPKEPYRAKELNALLDYNDRQFNIEDDYINDVLHDALEILIKQGTL